MIELEYQDKPTILIVDDQPQNIQLLANVLKEKYKLLIANSGDKAFKIMEKILPDLILLDVMMPDMDGFEVCSILQSHEETKSIPIIFLTAKSDVENVIHGLELGASDYITKPFSIRELNVRIKNLLNLSLANQYISMQKEELQEMSDELIRYTSDLYEAQKSVEENAFQMNKVLGELAESQEQIKIANEELEKSNKEKDKFFSIIAHDLKSPLASLSGLLQMIQDERDTMDDDEKHEILGLLLNNSKHVYDLLENLLEWSRVQRKALKFVPMQIPAMELAEETIQLLAAQAANKNITLRNDINPNIEIKADYMMYSTLVRNLVSNAIKFTPEGGLIIVSSEEENNFIRFKIIDNGVGMDEATKNKLFKIDEHITSLGTNNERGTGLGLILCQEFVALHGGIIGVNSEEGKGSEFYFTLPKFE
jgi:signal transduction histidine kinase